MPNIALGRTLQRMIEKRKIPPDHVRIIQKDVQKLWQHGISVGRVLGDFGWLVLGEIKHDNPPYRLYFLYSKRSDTVYIVAWEHKKRQRKIIELLQEKTRMILGGLFDVGDV